MKTALMTAGLHYYGGPDGISFQRLRVDRCNEFSSIYIELGVTAMDGYHMIEELMCIHSTHRGIELLAEAIGGVVATWKGYHKPMWYKILGSSGVYTVPRNGKIEARPLFVFTDGSTIKFTAKDEHDVLLSFPFHDAHAVRKMLLKDKLGLGDHCFKCGNDVKSRPMFNHTFVGCMC